MEGRRAILLHFQVRAIVQVRWRAWGGQGHPLPQFSVILCPREKSSIGEDTNFLLGTEASLKTQLASVLKTRWIVMVINELNLYHLAAKPRGEGKLSSKG